MVFHNKKHFGARLVLTCDAGLVARFQLNKNCARIDSRIQNRK